MGGFTGVVWGLILIIAGFFIFFIVGGAWAYAFSPPWQYLALIWAFIGIALMIYGKKVINK